MLSRFGLGLAEAAYAWAIDRRNRRYDRTGPEFQPPVPVISVGNITVGGTGKTPFVIRLARRLQSMRLRPAVVSRGYGSPDGTAADEELLIRRRCPDVPCVSDPDRIAACRAARDVFGVDVIALDDGFQHRRLARNLDIVLIDGMRPFGSGRLLPRGRLREPVASLARADAVVVTRCDQIDDHTIAMIEHTVREHAPRAPVLKCRHRVAGVERVDGTPFADDPAGKQVLLLTALGNPESFERTALTLGVQVAERRFFRDHHRYTRGDVDAALARVRSGACDLVMTTEKDAVKLAALGGYEHSPIAVVTVEIDFLGTGDTLFGRLVADALGQGVRR